MILIRCGLRQAGRQISVISKTCSGRIAMLPSWAHTGLGRFVKPGADHLNLLREILSGEEYSQVNLDISWDEVAKWIVADPSTLEAWVTLLQQYPDRFLFGSDTVAPKSQVEYLKAYDAYGKLWDRLDAQTARKVKVQNYERLFDAARLRVRAWEQKQAQLKK